VAFALAPSPVSGGRSGLTRRTLRCWLDPCQGISGKILAFLCFPRSSHVKLRRMGDVMTRSVGKPPCRQGSNR
jgi:hypothetical protein